MLTVVRALCPAAQVLELRKGSVEQARANFQTAQQMAEFMFEPFYNGGALLAATPALRLTPPPPRA